MIEVTMPGKAKDLRIKHFKSMALVPEEGLKTDMEKMMFLSAFTGLKFNQITQFTPAQIQKMCFLAMRAVSGLKLKDKLPDKITLGGQVFCLVDPDKVGIGWHIDFSSCSITKDPVRLACMFYLQEGYNYSDVDDNGNITHPIDSRYELFEKEFPLDVFMTGATFFLTKLLRSKRRSMVLKLAQMRTSRRVNTAVRVLSLLPGKRLSKR